MKFLCKLLIWTFCACVLAFRTQAKKGQRPITYNGEEICFWPPNGAI